MAASYDGRPLTRNWGARIAPAQAVRVFDAPCLVRLVAPSVRSCTWGHPGTAALASRQARAQAALAPDAALAQLLVGNAGFVAGRLTSFDTDLAVLKQNTVAKQEPFAAVLSCADPPRAG